MIRILHSLDAVDRGGTETLLYDVCANAKTYGMEMMVITSKGGELVDSFRNAGVECLVLPRRWKVDPPLSVQMRRLIRARGIDIVHCHSAVEAFHTYIATAGIPVSRVLSFHGYSYSPQTKAALRFLVRKMDANIAVSASFLQILRKREGFREAVPFIVLHNGVDPRRLDSGATDLRNELVIPPTSLLLGMIGNFGRWKDQATICYGLPLVFSRYPETHFVFVGDNIGKDAQEIGRCRRICLEEGISDRVHFLGRRSDVGGILRALDCAVFSSLEDTFGLAVVEAMMIGVPTLVSAIPPFVEISENGNHAALFKTGNPADFALRLTQLVDHLAEARIKSQRDIAWALEKYSIGIHMKRLAGIYQSVIDRRRVPRH
jgi:L-malate glycosyltransferase